MARCHNAMAGKLPESDADLEMLRSRIAELEDELAKTRHTESSTVSPGEHFHSFMHHNPATAWIKDAEGRYVYTNKAHQELCGYEPGAIIGKTDADIFAQHLVPTLRANDLNVIETGTALQTVETGSVQESDEVRSWIVCKFPLTDVDGKQLIGGVGLDITDQVKVEADLQRAVELQQLLFDELDHRVRNNLASLLTLIELSKKSADTVEQFAESIRTRVQAMSTVHTLLSVKKWGTLGLGELIGSMIPNDLRPNVKLEGPPVRIAASHGTSVGMLIQELVSNSLKYGALSNRGRTEVQWTAKETSDSWTIDLNWRERGGPPINWPCLPKIGTSLIKGIVRNDLRGCAELSYPPQGVEHRLQIEVDKHRSDSTTGRPED